MRDIRDCWDDVVRDCRLAVSNMELDLTPILKSYGVYHITDDYSDFERVYSKFLYDISNSLFIENKYVRDITIFCPKYSNRTWIEDSTFKDCIFYSRVILHKVDRTNQIIGGLCP